MLRLFKCRTGCDKQFSMSTMFPSSAHRGDQTNENVMKQQTTTDRAELKVRCTEQLRERLREAAKVSMRSMNCEMIVRLRASFDQQEAAQ